MTQPTANSATISTEPPVRPFWWLKRLSLTGIVLLLLLAITWVLWDQHSRRELQTRIDAYRKAGEPTTAWDLHPAIAPDKEDAAALYLQAAAAIDSEVACPSLSAQSYDFGEQPPYPPAWHTLAQRAMQVNAKVLDTARQASLRSGANWAVPLKSPLLDGKMSGLADLAGQRSLAVLLGDTICYEHFQGNDAQAMNDIAVLFHQARTLSQRPFLVSNLVGRGIEATALAHLEVMAGDLRIRSRSSTAGPSIDVSQGEVRQLISDLLGGRQAAEFLARAVREERVCTLDVAGRLFESSLLFKPMLRLGAVQAMDRQTDLARASLLPPGPAALAALMPLSPRRQAAQDMLRVWGSKKPVDPAVRIEALAAVADGAEGGLQLIRLHRHICEQRMTAVMLAFRMYVIDRGHYPQTLQDLVPAYLPALPADPMAADGRPFGYFIAMDGKRPILYSVGDDGIDQTQATEPDLPPHLLKGEQHIYPRQPDDQLRDLSSCKDTKPRPSMSMPFEMPSEMPFGLPLPPPPPP